MLHFQPIDNAAKHGRFVLVRKGSSVALVKWTGDHWQFSNGARLTFDPEEYYQTDIRTS